MIIDDKFADDFKRNVIGNGMYAFYERIQKYTPILAGIVKSYQERVKIIPSVLTFSPQDMVNLTIAFFEDFNSNLCNRLVETLQSAEVTILSDKNKQDGILPCATIKNDQLKILLERCKNINSLCTPPHEFAHAVSQRNVEKKSAKEDLLGEIESKFIEKVFADWLLENGVISQEDYKYKCDIQLQDLVADCKILLNESFVLKQLNCDYSKENLQKMVDANPHLEITIKDMAYGVDGIKNRWGKFFARYVVGELVAQVLYEDHQIAPVSTSTLFDEYMQNNADMELEEGITFLIGDNYKNRIINTFLPKNEQNQ